MAKKKSSQKKGSRRKKSTKKSVKKHVKKSSKKSIKKKSAAPGAKHVKAEKHTIEKHTAESMQKYMGGLLAATVLFLCSAGLFGYGIYAGSNTLIYTGVCLMFIFLVAMVLFSRMSRRKGMSELKKRFEESEDKVVGEIQELIDRKNRLIQEKRRIEEEMEDVVTEAWKIGEKELKAGLIHDKAEKIPEKKIEIRYEKGDIDTDIDKLYELIARRGTIGMHEAALYFRLHDKIIEDWAKILEMNKLIDIHYPVFGGIELRHR